MMYSFGNLATLGTLAVFAALSGMGFGDLVGLDDTAYPAVHVNEISLFSDGTAVYDRSVQVGVLLVWSGVVFAKDGTVHCQGTGVWEYNAEHSRITDKDVDWLVGGKCIDGLEAGMTYRFTWTPVDGTFSAVRYPSDGLGKVTAPPLRGTDKE